MQKLQKRQREREGAVGGILKRMTVIYKLVDAIPLKVPLEALCTGVVRAEEQQLLRQCGISETLCVDIRKENAEQFSVISILTAKYVREHAERILLQVRKTLAPLCAFPN